MPCGKMKALHAWRREYAKERREHPTLPAKSVKRIVYDHLHKRK